MRGLSSTFREIADIIEALEATDSELTAVTPITDKAETSKFSGIETTIRFPFIEEKIDQGSGDIKVRNASITEKGSLELQLALTPDSTNSNTENSSPSHSSESGSPSEESDNSERELGSDGGTETSKTNGLSLPAYRDPDQLQDVYETHDTFAEMTEALNVDVTSQTVRRYMIKHGIHDPSTNQGDPTTAAAETTTNPESQISSSPQSDGEVITKQEDTDLPQASREIASSQLKVGESTDTHQKTSDTASLADKAKDYQDSEKVSDPQPATTDVAGSEPVEGAEGQLLLVKDEISEETTDPNPHETMTISQEEYHLPDHLSLNEIRDCVQESKTLYEVQQQLSLDRSQARELLRELNLLDLVHGRLATRDLYDRSIEEINRRLQASPPT